MDHIGIDVHKRESQICILAEGGELIERRIRTTLSIARLREGVSELALLREWRPPFDPAVAIREAAGLIKSYSLTAVSGDRWAKGLVSDKFFESGIQYHFTDRTTSQFYGQIPAMLTSGAVRLLDSERLVRQVASLRRKLGSQGQEQVTHPGKAHDDCANSAAVALVLVRQPGAPQTVEEEEARRPEGSFEKHAREVVAGYEPAILAKYGEAQGRVLLANARVDASIDGDFDPEVYEAVLEDLLPGLARVMCGRRSAGTEADGSVGGRSPMRSSGLTSERAQLEIFLEADRQVSGLLVEPDKIRKLALPPRCLFVVLYEHLAERVRSRTDSDRAFYHLGDDRGFCFVEQVPRSANVPSKSLDDLHRQITYL